MGADDAMGEPGGQPVPCGHGSATSGWCLSCFWATYEKEFARAAARLCAVYGVHGVHELAQDILQDTGLELVKPWDGIRHPRAYTYTTLTRKVIDAGRRRTSGKLGPRDQDVPLDEDGRELVDRATPESAAMLDWMRSELRDALEQLPKQQRMVLIYRFLFGLTTEETAKLLGMSNGAVRSAQCRGLAKLRTLLPADLLGGFPDDQDDDGPGLGPEGGAE